MNDEIIPNTDGKSIIRRTFSSEKEWREISKAEAMTALNSALRLYNGELSVEVSGDAYASIMLDIQEYVYHADGEPGYFYQTIDLGAAHWADP